MSSDWRVSRIQGDNSNQNNEQTYLILFFNPFCKYIIYLCMIFFIYGWLKYNSLLVFCPMFFGEPKKNLQKSFIFLLLQSTQGDFLLLQSPSRGENGETQK